MTGNPPPTTEPVTTARVGAPPEPVVEATPVFDRRGALVLKITQDLREEVLAMAERNKGMAEKSAEFLEKGGKLYV